MPRDDPLGSPGPDHRQKGADIEKLRKKLSEMTNSETHLNIVEVRKPEVDATPLRSRSLSSSSAA